MFFVNQTSQSYASNTATNAGGNLQINYVTQLNVFQGYIRISNRF